MLLCIDIGNTNIPLGKHLATVWSPSPHTFIGNPMVYRGGCPPSTRGHDGLFLVDGEKHIREAHHAAVH